MIILYVLILLFICPGYGSASSLDAASDNLSPRAEELSNKCNLEARNALVNGDLELVEKLCTQAINELDKLNANKEYLINPMLNLAFSYTLAGHFDKAEPLYARARSINKQLYRPDSRKYKEIDEFITLQEREAGRHGR